MAINNLYHPQDPMLNRRKKKYVWKAKNWHIVLFLAQGLVIGWWIGVAWGGGR